MTDWAVCIDCGWLGEDTHTGLHSGKHLKAAGHRATVGTTNEQIAQRWAARYRAEADRLGSSLTRGEQ